ncbi:MAG: ABC transporter substrate-binding protein, partial [Candidatus Rokuibacteriota bacterium]
MTLRVCVGAVATLIALGALAPAARAGAPAERLRQFFGAANALIADEATAERPQEKLESIRRLVRGLFGFREAAEHALGAEWGARTPAERAEFVALFTEMAESSFVSAIASRARLDGGARVTVLDETEAADAATVRTAVAAKMGGEMRVDYRMRLLGGRWVVSDVAVDGVSLMDNYRAQVRRVVERSSYTGLLSEMRARARAAPGGAG